MHEKLYSMKNELTGMLKNDRLLKSAVREVNKIDMIRASLIVRNPNHESIPIDRILDGDLPKDVPERIMFLLRISVILLGWHIIVLKWVIIWISTF